MRVFAIATSLNLEPQLLPLIPPEHAPLRHMLSTMPPLRFGGTVDVVLELNPSASLLLNGQPSTEVLTLSRTHLSHNLQLWKQNSVQRGFATLKNHTCPPARILTLPATHFQLLQPPYLQQIVGFFTQTKT